MKTVRPGKTALAMLFAGLGGGVAQAQELPQPCERVGATATCHSCTHAVYGPFEALSAAASTGPVFVELNLPHTLYTVGLRAEGSGSYGGSVGYLPNNDEAAFFALYLDREIPVAVTAEAGEPVPPTMSHAIEASRTDCVALGYASELPCATSLPFVEVYALEPNVTYRITFGPAATDTVKVVMENLSSIGALFYADADGDGSGDPEEFVSSWCEPAESWVTDGDDCDDDDASAFPAAPDTCNGRDDDCDGEIDEDLACASDDASTPAAADAGETTEHDAGAAPDDSDVDASAASPSDDTDGDNAPAREDDAGGTTKPQARADGCAMTPQGEGAPPSAVVLAFLMAIAAYRRAGRSPRARRANTQ
jgi:Putative metal-binding motif